MNKPSVRFTVSRHNSLEDITALVENLAELSTEMRLGQTAVTGVRLMLARVAARTAGA